MKIYTLKLALRGISPLVWRRLLVPGVMSQATLHEAIQIVNSWDDDHLYCFHIYVVNYGIHYDGGVCYRGNVYKIQLDDFEFTAGDKFHYEYNFFENHIVDIRIEFIEEKDTENALISCIKGNGMPGVDKYDEIDAK